jgi:hypothetical protein
MLSKAFAIKQVLEPTKPSDHTGGALRAVWFGRLHVLSIKLIERHPVLPLHQSRSLPFQHPIAIREEICLAFWIPRYLLCLVYIKSFSLASDIFWIFPTYFYVGGLVSPS